MNSLSGIITIDHMPPNRGVIADMAFFCVDDENSAKPFDGNPTGDAIDDVERLLKDVDLNNERTDATRSIPFSISRPAGYYYIQFRFILFRFSDGQVFAQAEQFFFAEASLPLFKDISAIGLSVQWPSSPLGELGSYGVIKPYERPPVD